VRRSKHGIFYRVYGQQIVVTAVLDLRQSAETINREPARRFLTTKNDSFGISSISN
jgi:hypothetical protein